jgi:uncharacterized protein
VSATVAWLSVAHVKGTRLRLVDELRLDGHGAHNDRRFAITDEHLHLVNGKHLGALMQLVAEFDDAATRLTLRFPDRSTVSDRVMLGEAETMMAYGHPRAIRPVLGRLPAALSSWAGRKLRLVQPVDPADGVDRQRRGGVTLLSIASLAWLRGAADVEDIDPRRFRMTIGVAGLDAFAEERWLGRLVRIGAATVRPAGNVGRCVVTTQNPESGSADLQTLKMLARLRGQVPATEPLPFGVWGEVASPGVVRVGDDVAADG